MAHKYQCILLLLGKRISSMQVTLETYFRVPWQLLDKIARLLPLGPWSKLVKLRLRLMYTSGFRMWIMIGLSRRDDSNMHHTRNTKLKWII
jgi:hypothetical protein